MTIFYSPARGREEMADPVAPQACSELGDCLRLRAPAGVLETGLDAEPESAEQTP
jgi:hypothetical protein